MATELPIFLRTASTAFVGVDGSESAVGALKYGTTALTTGLYVGATVLLDGGGTDTITFRVYRDALKTQKIHEFSVNFSADPESSYSVLAAGVPFFSGLWATADGTGGAHNVKIIPFVRAIASAT